MKVAIISDIHGNAVALDTVLAELDEERPDRTVCLGDVAGMGPQPREVVARLRALDIPVVMGNVDEWILSPPAVDAAEEDQRRMVEILRWGSQQLARDDQDYIRSFQPRVETSLGPNATLLCFHGTPSSNTEVLLATTPDDELGRMLEGYSATVMTGGHTHVQMLRRYRDALILNPGSVGLPAEVTDCLRRPPWAEYALVTQIDGALAIDLRRSPIDVDAVARAARNSGMPHANWWIDAWRAAAS